MSADKIALVLFWCLFASVLLLWWLIWLYLAAKHEIREWRDIAEQWKSTSESWQTSSTSWRRACERTERAGLSPWELKRQQREDVFR
jgi:hypothetical protein